MNQIFILDKEYYWEITQRADLNIYILMACFMSVNKFEEREKNNRK